MDFMKKNRNQVPKNQTKMKKNNFKERDKATLPREKLALLGTSALNDAELLAIILGSGTKGKNVLELCQEIIETYGGLTRLGDASWQELTKIEGLGEVKAKIISVIFELGKRREQELRNRAFLQIKSVEEAKKYIEKNFPNLYSDANVEYFHVIFFNKANAVIKHQEISKGGFSATVVDVRVILKYALQCNASSMILLHNHPSGNPKPSNEEKIKNAGELMDIQILDHIIVTYKETYSMADNGYL
jgi:DNA repair protein RadC